MDIFAEQASGKLKEAKSFWGSSAKRSSHKSLIYVRMEKYYFILSACVLSLSSAAGLCQREDLRKDGLTQYRLPLVICQSHVSAIRQFHALFLLRFYQSYH